MRSAASLALLLLLAGCGEERAHAPRFIPEAQAAAIAPVDYRAEGAAEVGYASWYGDEFAGRPTANGERFEPEGLSAAHRTLTLPSWLEVSAPATGKTLVVRVNDRGPYANDRLIDLSQGAARELGLSGDGHARVRIRPVSLDEAKFLAELAQPILPHDWTTLADWKGEPIGAASSAVKGPTRPFAYVARA